MRILFDELQGQETIKLASKRDWKAWDEQIERDFSPGGRGAPLLTELKREIAEGRTRPMVEGSEGFTKPRK
jgi:hypothetical protein